MTIEQVVKLEYLDKISQSIFFNAKGFVVDSCDTIVSFRDKNIYSLDFFKEIRRSIPEIGLNQKVEFNSVYTNLFGYTSYFDFTLERIVSENDEKLFLLVLFDFGMHFKKAFEIINNENGNNLKAVSRNNENLLIKTSDYLINLSLNKILYFEAYGDYVKVHTDDKVHIYYNRMKNIEAKVPGDQFMRVHRSYIVNLNSIDQVEKECVQIRDKWIPVSASNKLNLIAHFTQ